MTEKKPFIQICDTQIGAQYKPFIIAEMSGNHNQSLSKAIEIVDAAAEAGADAIKLQTYTADTMTLNIKGGDFEIKDKNSLWAGQNLHKLYKKAYTPWEWHEEIFKRAKSKNMICFSSPFDSSAVDFLNELNVPAFKIASFENNHLPLIRKVASTGKPLIISTGLASLAELDRAVTTARESGCNQLILLKCTSTYPASPINSNLKTIEHMRKLFNVEVGLSDHTLGIGVAIASIALGATVIEKHFTLDRSEGGVDSSFSMEPDEFKSMVIEANRAWESIGNIKYGMTTAEKESLIFKRSIYTAKKIKKGEKFNTENIRIVRPGYGAPPYLYDTLLGIISKKDYDEGTPLSIEKLLN